MLGFSVALFSISGVSFEADIDHFGILIVYVVIFYEDENGGGPIVSEFHCTELIIWVKNKNY